MPQLVNPHPHSPAIFRPAASEPDFLLNVFFPRDFYYAENSAMQTDRNTLTSSISEFNWALSVSPDRVVRVDAKPLLPHPG